MTHQAIGATGYDSIYFEHRGVEWKDELLFVQWAQYTQPKTVFDYGAGTGKFVHIAKYFGLEAGGYDPFVKPEQVFGLARGAVSSTFTVPEGFRVDLVICNDVFEHLQSEKEVDSALRDIKRIAGKWVIFSITDLELWDIYKDATHVFCRTRKWWESKIRGFGFELVPVPNDWLFAKQLYLTRVVV